jgi:hypothetical protein
MPRKTKLSDTEILNDIKTKPTVPVWPHVGFAFDCCRNKAYEMARAGSPDEFLRLGGGEKRQMIRAITAPLRKRLGIEA